MKALLAVATLALLTTPVLAETRKIDLPGFSSVEISSGITGDITIGTKQAITLDAASSDILDKVRVEIVDNTLKASIDWNSLGVAAADRHLAIHITALELSGVTASSGASVTTTGVGGDAVAFNASSGSTLTAKSSAGSDYRLDASSGSHLAIDGTCSSAILTVSAGADVDAQNLLCGDVTVDASAGSHAGLHATGAIDAIASSGAGLLFHGTPTSITKQTDSGGTVEVTP